MPTRIASAEHRTRHAQQSERGSATVAAAIGFACLMVVVVIALQVAGATVARHRAEAAADFAALAGAGQALVDPESACDEARKVAQRNNSELTSCAVDGADVVAQVGVRLPVGVVGGVAHGRARAGPALVAGMSDQPPLAGAVGAGQVRVPESEFVPEALRGSVIATPTPGLARGIAAGFAQLGLPYVWGGGGDGAGPNDGCARGGGELNSCQGLVGFDCSGLTAFVLVAAGYASPGGDSGTQRARGIDVPLDLAQPGDLIGFPGHIAVHLGHINGVAYMLEASSVGVPVHVVPLSSASKVPDGMAHRYWQ